MEYLLISVYMSVMSAWSGGSLWPSQYFPKWLARFPEILFALGFVYALWPYIGYWAIPCGIWSWAWMESSTGPALAWGENPDNLGRPRRLSPIVNAFSDELGFKRGDINYCRLWMGIKGFLMTLPVGGFGLVLWPLGYEIGHRFKSNTLRELLAGFGASMCLWPFLA